MEGIQRICDQGNTVDLAVGVIIGAAFGANRQLARQRHRHAASQPAHRWARFLEQVRRAARTAERRNFRHSRGRGEGGRDHLELRQLRHADN